MADQMKGHIETIENPQGADQENQRGDTTEKDITQEEGQEKEDTFHINILIIATLETSPHETFKGIITLETSP